MDNITAQLQHEQLWRQFHALNTEMIINKAGRRIFPTLEYKLSGLRPDSHYRISLGMERADEFRYVFTGGKWESRTCMDPVVQSRTVENDLGIVKGEEWMNKTVSFDSARITNNPLHPQPHAIAVQSMHKYLPVLIIQRVPNKEEVLNDVIPPAVRISFDYTEFVTVTAYQSSAVTDLKVQNNPFAKAFKPDGRKNRRSDGSSTSSEGSSPKNARLIPPPFSLDSSPYGQFQHNFSYLPPTPPLDMPMQMPLDWSFYYQPQYNPYNMFFPYANMTSQMPNPMTPMPNSMTTPMQTPTMPSFNSDPTKNEQLPSLDQQFSPPLPMPCFNYDVSQFCYDQCG